MGAQPQLRRSLGRFDGTMIVMGTIIGIGIFFTPSGVAEQAGSPLMALLAWFVGGLIALAGGYVYAALGVAHPKTGGPYIYLREGLGRFPAFLYGWMLLMAIVSGAIAVIGLVFVDYLARFFPMGELARGVTAASVILGLTVINVLGVQWGSRVQNLFTLLKIVSLAGLIVAGISRGSQELLVEVSRPAESTALAGFVSAMVGVLFSFGGWQNLSNVAGEMKRPASDLPKAIFLGLVGVAILYLLANLAYLRLLPFDELVGSKAPAAAALERAIGESAGDVTAILILCSAFGILNGLLLSAPRVYFAMARDGLLPRMFGHVHPRFRTPVPAILVQSGMAALLVFWGNVYALLDYVVFADWLFFALNALALFLIVRKGGAGHVNLRAFGYPWVPFLFGTLGAAVAVGILYYKWENAWKGLLILLAGALVFAVHSHRTRAGSGGTPRT
ncbi:MAG: amino acid permease [Planctomycetota bacterium]